MKAILLAGGLGARLRPLTETIPKPLVPISGKPLLAYHLDSLVGAGVNEVLINTHYLPDKMEAFLTEYRRSWNIRIMTVYEPKLLGSAGTVRANRAFFGNEPFFIVYADNLTDIDYNRLLAHHKTQSGIITIACYREDHPEQKGIIEFDQTLGITRFIEKPKSWETASRHANAGIYVADSRLLDCLAEETKIPLDFGFDIFPKLLLKGVREVVYLMDETILDIGTPESYTRAQVLVNQMSFNRCRILEDS